MDEFVHISLERWTKICLELKELERLKGSSDNEREYKRGLERGLDMAINYVANKSTYIGVVSYTDALVKSLSDAGYKMSITTGWSADRTKDIITVKVLSYPPEPPQTQ